MKITILAIGKKHDAKLVNSINDYTKRLSHYVTIDWRLVETNTASSMTELQVRQLESEALLKNVVADDTVYLLDEKGTQLSTIEFSEKLQVVRNQSTRHLIIIIGGAYGVSKALIERADMVISLSKMVFPHQLVRLLLIEQLYRAHTILAGEKYHHM